MENGKRSAYPCDNNNDKNHLGLTKREYFAGLSMQGMLANPDFMQQYGDKKYLVESKVIAEVSIHIADELLKQLEK